MLTFHLPTLTPRAAERSDAIQDFAWIRVTQDLVYGFIVCHWLCQCSAS